MKEWLSVIRLPRRATPRQSPRSTSLMSSRAISPSRKRRRTRRRSRARLQTRYIRGWWPRERGGRLCIDIGDAQPRRPTAGASRPAFTSRRDAQGRGIGRAAARAHLDLLKRQGFVTAIAGIALPNEAASHCTRSWDSRSPDPSAALGSSSATGSTSAAGNGNSRRGLSLAEPAHVRHSSVSEGIQGRNGAPCRAPDSGLRCGSACR